MLISIAHGQRGKNMTEWITCPKCGALMIGMTYGHLCPLCGYRVPAQTITTTTGTSVEYVPVIHCKDCKYYKRVKGLPKRKYCHVLKEREWIVVDTEPDDFCSYGERKDE